MYCIANELQTAVASTSEDSDYPDDNLLDERPKKLFKAVSGVSPVTITLSIAAGSNIAALLYTNADSAVITIKDSGASTIETKTYSSLTSRNKKSMFCKYATESGTATAEFALTKASGQIEAGIARAGLVDTIKDPKYDMQEGRNDLSVEKILAGGGHYYKKRDILKTFSGQIGLKRTTDALYEYLQDIADELGPTPAVWIIDDGVLSWANIVWAKLDVKSATATYRSRNYAVCNFKIEEVL